jgi:hypothetical protein
MRACALAQRLNDAIRDGRLVDAYRVLSGLEPDDAELVALRAGFTVITKRNRREFFNVLSAHLGWHFGAISAAGRGGQRWRGASASINRSVSVSQERRSFLSLR